MKITLNIKLGIAAGIINCVVWYLIAKSLGYYSFTIEQYRYFATLILLLFGITISIYFERKNKNGFIEFKDAVKSGIVYSLVLCVILAIFNYIYYKYMVPDAVEYFASEVKKTMVAAKAKEEDITKNLETVKSYFGSFRMFMSTLILGILLSLIAGAILRKKNPHTFNPN